MPQHDMIIANANFPTLRADVNDALAALVANSSGATAPATTYAHQWWANTTAGILKRRNTANSGWIDVMSLTTGLIIDTDVQAYDANTVKKNVANTFTAAQRGAYSPLTDGATITPDFALANQYRVQLGGNRTLANPSNLVAGQSGAIDIYQDSTGSRTLAYQWGWQFAGGTAPTLTTTARAKDKLAYSVDVYAQATVTITIATPGVVTWNAHGLMAGQQVQLSTTGALPTGLAAATTYFVIPVDANSFRLSATQSGAAINTTGSQSGVHTMTAISITGSLDTAAATGGITLGTPVASTSGTSIDFTSIPAGTKRITVMFYGVSTNGASPVQIQLGDSGGIETTGYLGATSRSGSISAANNSAGFLFEDAGSASIVRHGSLTLCLLSSSGNIWTANGNIGRSDTANVWSQGGSKPLSATLDRVRITTAGGTDTFDAGTVNISYE